MTMGVTWDDLAVGTEAEPRTYGPLTRTDFVRYQGASGDFNPIHHDETFAKASGFPTVFSVGMLQAGILASFATDWLGAANVRVVRGPVPRAGVARRRDHVQREGRRARRSRAYRRPRTGVHPSDRWDRDQGERDVRRRLNGVRGAHAVVRNEYVYVDASWRLRIVGQ